MLFEAQWIPTQCNTLFLSSRFHSSFVINRDFFVLPRWFIDDLEGDRAI